VDVSPEFFKEYCVYKVSADKTLWNRLDDLDDFEASCGTGTKGNISLYIMSKHNQREIRDRLEAKNISFSTISATQDFPLKLLINAVCRDAGFATLSGKNYYIPPALFYKGEQLLDVVDIPEIWVSRDNVLTVHSTRFVRYDPDYHKSVPIYRYEKGRMKKVKRAEGICYVRKGIPGYKADSLAYLDSTDTGYLMSRVAIISLIVDKINGRFGGFVKVTFDSLKDVAVFRGERATKYRDMLDANIHEHFKLGADLVDVPEFSGLYGIPCNGNCKVMLVEEKDSYEEGEDVYEASLDVQHLTRPLYEKARGSKRGLTLKTLARACLTELAIKQDVAGSIDSFSGYMNSLDDMAVFILKEEGTCHYVKKAGIYLEFGSFDTLLPPEWVPEEVLFANESLFILRNGAVIGLRDTDMTPLPSETAWSVIAEKEGKVRGQEFRNDIMGGILDAHIFEKKGRKFYYSSIIGSGMQPKIAKADKIIELIEYKAPESYEWLLPYVCVTYINAGNRFTKYPYPFKYLKEWMKVQRSGDFYEKRN